MDECTYTPSQMIKKDEHQLQCSGKLFKCLNSKQLKSTSFYLLSSIITLLILGLANSSFAFPAKLQGMKAKGYWEPKDQGKSFSDRWLVSSTTFDVAFCRPTVGEDGNYIHGSKSWCYIIGEIDSESSRVLLSKKFWIQQTSLCSYTFSPLDKCKGINPIQDANWENKKRLGNYYCNSSKIADMSYYLLGDQEYNRVFCPKSSP